MRGNPLGFANDKPSIARTKPTTPDDTPTLELESPNKTVDMPMCATRNDAVCCCALTAFLLIGGVTIGVWYIVALS